MPGFLLIIRSIQVFGSGPSAFDFDHGVATALYPGITFDFPGNKVPRPTGILHGDPERMIFIFSSRKKINHKSIIFKIYD